MKVSVYDSYVLKKEGNTMHFDILVREKMQDLETILDYGRAYLISENQEGQPITADECKLCHIEEASEEVVSAIDKQGYYILRMEDIPSKCPENPSRRQLIQYLRAKMPAIRFANFRDYSEEQLLDLAKQTGSLSD